MNNPPPPPKKHFMSLQPQGQSSFVASPKISSYFVSNPSLPIDPNHSPSLPDIFTTCPELRQYKLPVSSAFIPLKSFESPTISLIPNQGSIPISQPIATQQVAAVPTTSTQYQAPVIQPVYVSPIAFPGFYHPFDPNAHILRPYVFYSS